MTLVEINKKRVLLLGLVIVIMAISLLAYTGGSGLVFGSPSSVSDLPQGVVMLTPAIPTMGEHWANPDNMPLGPIYLAYKGDVIGIEYMYSQDMLSEISIPTPEGVETFYELANVGVDHRVDHFEVGFMPEGHEGFEVTHWDIHIYFVSHAEHLTIAPEPAS